MAAGLRAAIVGDIERSPVWDGRQLILLAPPSWDLLVQSGWTAGPDGVREPRPHHSSGIDVPMNRQASLGCVGSTDCAITRHCSLASSRTWLSGLGRRGHALVVLMPVHHRPGDARGLVG